MMDQDLGANVREFIDEQLSRWGAQSERERRAQDHKAMIEGVGRYVGYGKRRKFVKYEDS